MSICTGKAVGREGLDSKGFQPGGQAVCCGSAMVGEGVAATTKKIYLEAEETMGKDLTDEEVNEWFRRIRNDRYASDIFV
jgi:cytochrome P450/NADPH-cytochrome P450 reductase